MRIKIVGAVVGAMILWWKRPPPPPPSPPPNNTFYIFHDINISTRPEEPGINKV